MDHRPTRGIFGRNRTPELVEGAAGGWGSRRKDVLEDELHRLVCEHRLPLGTAQQAIARNWVAAYQRYHRERVSAASHGIPSQSSGTPFDPSTSSGLRTAPRAGKVWVNTTTKFYHWLGDRYYGKTRHGEYLT